MKKRLSGFPIARDRLFTLANGIYVIQWNDQSVQSLFGEHTYPYRVERDYGAPISDFELKQMKQARRISHFNRQYVWLSALPSPSVIESSVPDSKRITQLSIRVEADTAPRRPLADAQQALDSFSDGMDTGQMIRTSIPGRQVVLILQNASERDALKQLLNEMQFDVTLMDTAQQALLYLEDHRVDLWITDLHLPDMHAWQMIAKLHEIVPYSNTPVLVITDEVMPGMRAFAGEHISRPVSISRLRYHLWKVLQDQPPFDKVMLDNSLSSTSSRSSGAVD